MENRRGLGRILECASWLGKEVRRKQESPSLGKINSRSVKTSYHVDANRGIDGNKKIKGRKERIVVDTLCLPMAIKVHKANIYDSKGTMPTIKIWRKIPKTQQNTCRRRVSMRFVNVGEGYRLGVGNCA